MKTAPIKPDTKSPPAGYGVPRKLKCAGCQIGDHCDGEDDGCYCECTEKANPFP